MIISVITTTYNRKRYLTQTIESVQKSILSPYDDVVFEHIIYDDGSTDGTDEIFETNNWKNVLYVRDKVNRGQSYGKNVAIGRASGDFIFMLDSDDIVLQRTLHSFIKESNDNPNVDFFISDFIRVDNNLKYLMGMDYYGWDFETIKDILSAIFKGEHFIQNNTFFKKSIFLEAGMFDEKLKIAEDLDLYIRFLFNGHLPRCSNFISHLHRIHSGNMSKNVTLEKHFQDVLSLKVKYISELKKIGLDK